MGLWIGLSLGLVVVGLALLLTWTSRIRALRFRGLLVRLP
jgi:hypothetical protein